MRASSAREWMFELPEVPAEVVLDRLRAEEERGRDLLVRLAVGDEPGDVLLLGVSSGSGVLASSTRSPVARSSATARAAHGSAPTEANVP